MASNFSITFLPNTWFNSEIKANENLDHNGMDLCFNGYLFKRHRINKNSINWICKVNGCNASVTLTRDDKLLRFSEHKTEINHEKLDDQEMIRIQFNTNCKIRAESESHNSVGKIYLEEQSKIKQTSNLSYEELSKVIGPFTSIKSTLTKRKKKFCPKLAKNLRELEIPEEFKLNNQNEKFLIYNNDNKILVFASPTQLKALSQATHWLPFPFLPIFDEIYQYNKCGLKTDFQKNLEMQKSFRTVCALEKSVDNKFSNHLSVAHPDIFKAISKFKEEETDASLKYYRAINNENAPARKKLNVINDAILNNHRQMLLDSEISIDTYSKYVSMMCDLNALDKKKNKIQQDAHD
ncbi:unnamed protein product, partial [Brachionus calyciflorus]